MADVTTINSILRSKLQRPPAIRDYVHRPRLLTYLDRLRHRHLTSVSVSAECCKNDNEH